MSIFPKSEHRILKLVYENPGMRLSELIGKARVSVETGKKRLDHLLNLNVIKEEKIMGGKRTLIRNFYPNLKSEEGRSTFSLIESEKREEFFRKNRNLVGPFKQLLRNLDKKIKVVIIFGSFGTYSQTVDSDLDILFLVSGKIDTEDLKKEIERSFVTFDHEISPRIDTMKNFRRNINKEIYQTITRNHIIVKGNSDYIGLIS